MKYLRGTNRTVAKETKSNSSKLQPSLNSKRAVVSTTATKAITSWKRRNGTRRNLVAGCHFFITVCLRFKMGEKGRALYETMWKNTVEPDRP